MQTGKEKLKLSIWDNIILYIENPESMLVTQSFLTLCHPLEPAGSSVHGILQARILELSCHSLKTPKEPRSLHEKDTRSNK